MTKAEELEFDSEELPAEGLSKISGLAIAMRLKALEIAEAEEKLKVLQSEFAELEQRQLPQAMQDLGMTEFTLNSGERVSVRKEYYGAITAAHEEAAFAWLREHNSDALIKNTIGVTFGKGQEAAADAIHNLLQHSLGPEIPLQRKRFVHPQTLRAFIRERIEAEQPLPRELFGVIEINRAKIEKRGD